jgi:hypothetical protein
MSAAPTPTSGGPVRASEDVVRLSSAVPGLSVVDYRAILRVCATFDEAVDVARLKLRTVI